MKTEKERLEEAVNLLERCDWKMEMDKKKLEEAVKLLEKCYGRVHNGCSYDSGKLSMIDDSETKREIAIFVNSVKGETVLEVPKVVPFTLIC